MFLSVLLFEEEKCIRFTTIYTNTVHSELTTSNYSLLCRIESVAKEVPYSHMFSAFFSLCGMLKRSRCVQIFYKNMSCNLMQLSSTVLEKSTSILS